MQMHSSKRWLRGLTLPQISYRPFARAAFIPSNHARPAASAALAAAWVMRWELELGFVGPLPLPPTGRWNSYLGLCLG